MNKTYKTINQFGVVSVNKTIRDEEFYKQYGEYQKSKEYKNISKEFSHPFIGLTNTGIQISFIKMKKTDMQKELFFLDIYLKDKRRGINRNYKTMKKINNG